MAYDKQVFIANQTLKAEELNKMNDQIEANEIAISSKQNTLISGENIKTVNGQSILGPGNINIEGGNGTVEKTTEEEITAMGFTKNTGTVTAVKINGTTKTPSNGVVDLGEINSVEYATNAESAKKVENKLTINVNGTSTEFDGSSSKTVNITTGTGSVNTSLFDVALTAITITQNSPTGTEIDSNLLEDVSGKLDWISLCKEKFIYKTYNFNLPHFVNIKLTPKTNTIKIVPTGSISESFTVTYNTTKARFEYNLSFNLPSGPKDTITGAPNSGTDPFLDAQLFEFKALVLDGETIKTVDASLPLYFNA